MPARTIFLSYSRRQLYFAESLVLHLQKSGLDVWFDLQQLRAGTVWADGLEGGMQDADRLVLVVSKAALDSPWTRAEWQGLAGKGAQLVLAVFEAVELPDELRDLPTFDFRSGFDHKVRALIAYLDGSGEPHHDHIPAPNLLGLPFKLPVAVSLVLFALFAPLIASLPLPFALGEPSASSWIWGVFSFFVACAVAIAAGFAVPFWRRSITYKGLKRGLFWSGMLCLAMLILVIIADGGKFQVFPLVAAWFLNLIVHLGLIRRSGSLLRWMQADEKLQGLRRRVHVPLMSASQADLSMVDASEGPPFTYALHFDIADRPLAYRLEAILRSEGHRRIAADEGPRHHIAILTNRSSRSWMAALTQTQAGRLVCVVASTIELGEWLKETARYQWVDFRGGDRRDIETLARSLSNPEAASREAGLEATPEMIDRWKVPAGISLLKAATEILGTFILIFGATDVIGAGLAWIFPTTFCPDGAGDLGRSTLLSIIGIGLLWLASQALVYRRVPAALMYGLLVAASVGVALSANVLPEFLRDSPWVPLALYLPFLLFSWFDGRYWLPGFARANPDAVGIKRSIEQAFHKRNVVKVFMWVTLVVASASYLALK